MEVSHFSDTPQVERHVCFLAYSLPACIETVEYLFFLFFPWLLNAYDDSVSGVCCSTAVPARGGDILTRSGVRLGIICTYIHIYIYNTPHILCYINIVHFLRASTDLTVAMSSLQRLNPLILSFARLPRKLLCLCARKCERKWDGDGEMRNCTPMLFDSLFAVCIRQYMMTPVASNSESFRGLRPSILESVR